jgi:hypothetical protein
LQAKSPLAIDAELWWRKKCGQHYHIQTGEPCWGSLVAVCGSNLWHNVCPNRPWEIFPVDQLSLGDVSESKALDWPKGKGSESGLVKALLCHYTISPGHFASMLSWI